MTNSNSLKNQSIAFAFQTYLETMKELLEHTIKESDTVNHPSHYQHPSGIECIEIVRHENFNRGNAIKYIWRSGKKDPEKEIEDLEKAIFYLQNEINRLKDSVDNKPH